MEIFGTKRKERVNKSCIFLVMAGCLLLGQATCFAETVTLSWDANSEADLAGYKVYYKADSFSPPFDGVEAIEGISPLNVRHLTTATISGLDPARTYHFAVTAYNATGNESTYSNIVTIPQTISPPVTPARRANAATVIVIHDLTAPAVMLTAPAGNATVRGTVAITASASDDVGVSMVEFYQNDTLLFASNVAPYTFNWNTTSVGNGRHSITARAHDSVGNVTQSSNVSVSVNNSIPDSTWRSFQRHFSRFRSHSIKFNN